MKNILQRTLSAFVCLVMIASSLPAFSEAAPSATLEIIEEVIATPAPADAPEITAEPSVDPTPEIQPEETIPAEEAPEASVSPQPESTPAAEETAAPEATPEAEGDVQVLTMEQALSALSGEEAEARTAADPAGFTYTISNGEAAIISYSGGEAVVTVPALLEDIPVTIIAEQAFAGCTGIQEILLPESLHTIGSYAFMNCTGLVRVTLLNAQPDAALSIGENAFFGCSALESLALPYCAEIGTAAFEGCAALTLEVFAGSAADIYCAENAIPFIHRESIQPEAILPEKAKITIGLKEKVSLAAYTLEPEGAQAQVSYSSKKKSYASVNAEGVVTGQRAGKSTTITLKTDNGKKCTVTVNVKKAPSSIKLSAERTVIGVGEQLKLKTSLSSGSASYAIRYTSSDESIATVDAKGVITALQPGTVSFTAETYNGKTVKNPLEITILPAPETITLSESEITLGKGASCTLAYTLNEGSAGTAAFASSDETIAIVDETGKITAMAAEGSAVITATTHNGVSTQCTVNAMPAPGKISVTAERKTIGVGEKIQLTTTLDPEDSAAALKFKSSKSSVASVNQEGVVTAKKAGTATITVTTHNNKKATIKFTVKKAPSSIKLSAGRTTIGVGEQLQMKTSLSKGTAAAVQYLSSDETVATVDAKGVITALQPGTVCFTAETHNGKATKAPLEITVLPAPETLSLSESEITLARNDSRTLVCTLNEGSAGAITFSTSDSEIASVNASGKITAGTTKGTAIITAVTYNGVQAECAVTVTHGPGKVSLSAARKTIGVGEQLQLVSSLSPEGAAATLKFKSSKSSVASVNQDGVVTGKKAGTATITATTHNNKKTSIKITVKKAPSSVTVVAPRSLLGAGEQMQLAHKLSSGSVGTVVYESLTPEIAAVTPDGMVTALVPGTARFIATAHNGKASEPCTVEIAAAPQEILLDNSAFLLGAEQTAVLSAWPNEGSAGVIHYASEDAGIAAIDAETGEITAVAPGKTRVYAATYVEGLAAYADIEVRPAPSFVSLPFDKIALGAGDTLQLAPEYDEGAVTALRYSSKDSKIASVSAEGLVTAVAAGETTITVKTHNGASCKLSVTVKKAPSSITAVPAELTLGVGETGSISYKLSSGSAATVRMENKNSNIVSLDENGMVTALAVGTAEILLTTHNGKTAVCTVNVAPAPEKITLSAVDVLCVDLNAAVSTALYPEGSAGAISYSIVRQTPVNGEEGSIPVIQIDANGTITALNPGTAVLRASTYREDVYAEHTITVLPAPTRVAFAQDAYTVNVDETLQLMPLVDEGCWTEFTFTAKKDGFFTIDANGLVTPIMRGTTTVTVTTHNGLSASAKITVVDPYYPEEMVLAQETPEYMESGSTYLPVITTVPETAVPAIKWTSSNAEVVEVDEITGEITAISYGQSTITGTSTRNPSLKVSYKVTVLDDDLCLTMPATRTNTSRINKTLSEIRAVRSSAYQELDRLYAQGVITKADRDKRKATIERAFEMHLFPWMTDTKELYWNANNSNIEYDGKEYSGAKDYKPGIVYYGLPYTQTNRNFNVDKAVNKGYFTKSSKGYYKMQGDKFTSRYYPGNDCSSYASMSVYGTESDYSYLNTRSIAKSSGYRTLTDWTDLRPGDLLNKSGSHVVIFLYYANEAKTQMVIIEQGGSASADRGIDNIAYSNTIACSIKNVSYYTSRSYKIRRPIALGY